MITIQHIAVRTENLQAEAQWDDRDAGGNILRNGRSQLTLSTATRDALLAEATVAVTADAAFTPQNMAPLLKSRDATKAELARLTEQVATKAAELEAITAAVDVPETARSAP